MSPLEAEALVGGFCLLAGAGPFWSAVHIALRQGRLSELEGSLLLPGGSAMPVPSSGIRENELCPIFLELCPGEGDTCQWMVTEPE